MGYRPLIKTCEGNGDEVCQTVYESSCTTKYVEKQPGKFVGDTKCEKLPVEICGRGCTTTEGDEECHNKKVTSLLDVPEEVCDLNPQKTCRLQTRLVPSLKPEHECTIIPQEICNLKFTNPEQVDQPLKTKWCLDPLSPPLVRPMTRQQPWGPPSQAGMPSTNQILSLLALNKLQGHAFKCATLFIILVTTLLQSKNCNECHLIKYMFHCEKK